MTISNQQPAWTHEEGLNFECAREAITDVMGILSAQIHTTTAPDALAELRAKRSELAQERERLSVADHDDIARIRAEYGQIVRKHINTKKRDIANKNMLASWALEGFEPSPDFIAQLEQYVSGQKTLDELLEEIKAKFHEPEN